MRTIFILTALLLIAGSAQTVGVGGGKGSNSAVQFSVATERKKLSPADVDTLLFTLHPKSGIHINLEPGLTISIDSSSGVSISGKPEIPVNAKTNFLQEDKPIRQAYRLPAHLSSDSIIVSGVMTYYYCSDAEGWCSRFKQPFSVKIRVLP
jgi:hypothetical protein